MQQRRLKYQGEEEEEEKEKKGKKKGSDLKIHDLEDELEMSSDDSEFSDTDGTACGRGGVGWGRCSPDEWIISQNS